MSFLVIINVKGCVNFHEMTPLDLRDFARQIGSFIVGCKWLPVCVDFVDGVEKRGKGEGEGEKDGWWRKTPQKSLI